MTSVKNIYSISFFKFVTFIKLQINAIQVYFCYNRKTSRLLLIHGLTSGSSGKKVFHMEKQTSKQTNKTNKIKQTKQNKKMSILF